jgi:MoaA/NifB/PqqE/SkfB family radical SAM enzyme
MAEENIGQLEPKANPQRSAGELTFEEVQTLYNASRHSARVPLFILTGGDPAKRSDIFDIVVYAHEKGCASQATAASLAADLLIAWSVLSAPQAGDRLRAS